jgi:hypothetical protein
MCGTNSIEAVEPKAKKGEKGFVVTVAKLLFVVGEDGQIGTSHSEIRSLGKIGGARYTNLNAVKGGFKYENGVADWYVSLQGKTEAALANAIKKMAVSGPAYAKKVAVARRLLNKSIEASLKLKGVKAQKAAQTKANATFNASKKAAFATIAKLGGIAR